MAMFLWPSCPWSKWSGIPARAKATAAVVVDVVVVDTGQSARALVFGLHGAAPDRENQVVSGEVVLLDVGRYGVRRPRRNEYAPNPCLCLGVADARLAFRGGAEAQVAHSQGLRFSKPHARADKELHLSTEWLPERGHVGIEIGSLQPLHAAGRLEPLDLRARRDPVLP